MSINNLDRSVYEFFVSNQTKIKEAHKFYDDVLEAMYSQIGKASELLNMNLVLSATKSDKYRYFKSSKTDALYFTVYVGDHFFINGEILLILELGSSGIARLSEIEKIEFSSNENIIINTKRKPTGKSYHHFATDKLELKTADQYINLSLAVSQKIADSGLKTIFEKIENLF